MGEPRRVLYVASDLVWSSRIKATADACGLGSKRVYGIEGVGEVLGSMEGPVLVLVDLEAEGSEDVIAGLRGEGAVAGADRARVVAWGPHVMEDRLEWARGAGVEMVLARGAFGTKLEGLMRGFADVVG